jgi:hypothetical protein
VPGTYRIAVFLCGRIWYNIEYQSFLHIEPPHHSFAMLYDQSSAQARSRQFYAFFHPEPLPGTIVVSA